nr:hypothetical protein [uncultured Methanoregula sp.]
MSEPDTAELQKKIADLHEAYVQSVNNQNLLQENLTVLEQQLSQQGWENIGSGLSGRDFTVYSRNILYDTARIYWLKNPLIRRAELVQALYVFAQGMTVKAENPDVDAVVQKFIGDRMNYKAFTGHQAWMMNEAVLALSGNLFFALFTNLSTGRVIVRQISPYEIADIITDPEDSAMPWYYKRTFEVNQFSAGTGLVTPKIEVAYYPDWRYNPEDKPTTINGKTVHWEAPVYHIKTNCLPDMKFGVSELYSTLDWAKAYKTHLENGNKIWQALASFAFKMTTKGGQSAIAATATKIKSLIGKPDGTASTPEQRPVASTFTSGESVKLEPFKTSGMTISMEDARSHRLMVCSGSGIPDHIESGDVSTGNLATSKSMERPLELQFQSRQKLWIDIWEDILEYVIDQAIKAKNGPLKGTEEDDEYIGEIRYILRPGKEEGAEEGEDVEPASRAVSVTFPPLLEHDQLQLVQAIISAATLDGKPLSGTMDMRTVTRLVLQALMVEGADELIDTLYPEGQPPVMQTTYATQQQANAAAQALALAQQQRSIPDQQGTGGPQQPPGSVQESASHHKAGPLVTEHTQAYKETEAALIEARKAWATSIMTWLEKNYPKGAIQEANALLFESEGEGRWVTINGAHIFIDDGETPEGALAELKSGRSKSHEWTSKAGGKFKLTASEYLTDTTPSLDGVKGTPSYEHSFDVKIGHDKISDKIPAGEAHLKADRKLPSGETAIVFNTHGQDVGTVPPKEVTDILSAHRGKKARSEAALNKIRDEYRAKEIAYEKEKRERNIRSGLTPSGRE